MCMHDNKIDSSIYFSSEVNKDIFDDVKHNPIRTDSKCFMRLIGST